MDLPITNDQKDGTATGHRYDAAFMEYAVLSNTLSARAIIQILLNSLPIASVLDVGCATGTWLKEWKAGGVADVCGVDGDYVKRDQLQISSAEFMPHDLSLSFRLERTFDLVQSLEVAEHLAAESASRFVESLTEHSSGLVLFSAAPPGQGGEFHINEQPFEYWRTLFRQRGFVPYDYIRPRIADRADISFWYRYNVLLYVREDRMATLPQAIAATRLRDGEPVSDISPLPFKLRKFLLQRLPYSAQQTLARLKSRILPDWRI
jgi:SAM-dependent methyltransferase